MGFKISNEGLNLIKKWEGLRLTAYKCAAGVWTIGYGHTGGVYAGMKISESQATEYLRQDCQRFENYVNNRNYVPITLNQNQFDALVSFAFNCGQNNLKKLCEGRSAQQIANALPNYNKAAGKVLSGLTQRRNEEKALFLRNGASSAEPVKTTSSKGSQKVKDLQTAINKDGIASPKLSVDGLIGPKTNEAIAKIILKAKKDSNNKYVVGSKGELVRFVQKQVNVSVDGSFGKNTRDAVIAYQKKKKLSADGVVGKNTINAMIK